VTWKVWEENILGQMSLLLQVLVHAQVREVLNVGGDLGQGLLENEETEKVKSSGTQKQKNVFSS
jgi:hypothetical protein